MTDGLGFSFSLLDTSVKLGSFCAQLAQLPPTVAFTLREPGLLADESVLDRTIVTPFIQTEHYQGSVGKGVSQEFYGHVIVRPRQLDLGLVLSAKLFVIGVWNITGYMQRMTSWTINGLDGVTLDNVDGYPVNYGPGAYRNYLVTVGATGAAQIAGSIEFNFAGGITGTDTTITGSRLIVFGFEPNWREPTVESLEWMTDVLTAHNGAEQRLMLRQAPRRSQRYLFTFETQNKVNQFEGYLWGWQNRVFVLPVWTDGQYLGAPLAPGATTINVPTRLRDFAANRLLLLWRDYITWEAIEVESITPTQIKLKKAVINHWTAQDKIFPARLGRLSKTVSIQRPTSSLAEATLTFSYEVGEAVDASRLGTSTWPQLEGLDVLTVPPMTTENELTEDYERDIEFIDHNKGGWEAYTDSTAPLVSRPYSVLCKSRQEVMNLLAFLETRKGKCVPFWMPTWSKDIELTQEMAPTDVAMLIKNIGYTRYIKFHPNRRHLIFYHANEQQAPTIKTITGSGESSNNQESMSLDSAFGANKKNSDFKAISFLTYCRMDQDSFELTWHTDSIATLSFRVREVLR